MYQLSFADNRRGPLALTEAVSTIGRGASNWLVIDDATVSEQHAKLIFHDGRLFLQDNRSANGSLVNGKRTGYKELQSGDTLTLGDVELRIETAPEVPEPSAVYLADTVAGKPQLPTEPEGWRLVSDSSWLAGREFRLSSPVTVLGRGKDCTIVIPGTHLSRHHAQLRQEGNRLVLRDLGSTNGSYVNEVRIEGEQEIRVGDRLRFDVYSFRVFGPPDAPTSLAEAASPRKLLNLENTLQNIEALKSQEYQPKEWVTKPTSHGNRYHEVPKRDHHFGPLFWFSVVLGLSVLGILTYIVISF